jgi:TFIIF-interacting CTD phosphatase-like protein
MFKDRNLKEIVIVDNSASCYIKHLDNAIPIIPFLDNNADNELKD